MNARGKKLLHVFMPVLVGCLLVLTYTVYAAPPTIQKSIQPAKTATSPTSPAPVKYDPNAPPKGTITISASTKGNVNASTWFPETYQYIQWTCNGTRSNLVDVNLWHNNSKYADISKGISTGQTGYKVPKNMTEGNYELRITSQDDPRVEARKTVYVRLFEIAITAPKANEVLFLGDNYTVTWTYKGNPPPITGFTLCATLITHYVMGKPVTKEGCGLTPTGQFSSITTGMGKGSAIWTLPTQPPKGLDKFFLKITLPVPAKGQTSSFGIGNVPINPPSESVFGVSSPGFSVACKLPYTKCSHCGPYIPGAPGFQPCLILHYCANLLNDVKNCGGCANKCGPNMVCDQGKCK